MKKVSDILPYFIKELKLSMKKREIISICYIVIKHYLNYNRSDTIIYSQNDLKRTHVNQIKLVVA